MVLAHWVRGQKLAHDYLNRLKFCDSAWVLGVSHDISANQIS